MYYSLESPEWKFLQTTANRAIDRAFKDGLDSLSKDEQVFFLVWIADGEVGNGGMHAVCYNSTGDYLWNIPDAFRIIGAAQKAQAFERLIHAFGPVIPSAVHPVRIQQHAELSDDAIAQIDAIDSEYFQIPETVELLLYQWCQSRDRTKQGT